MWGIAKKYRCNAIRILLVFLAGLFTGGLSINSNAQDILSSDMACYLDILEDWKDQDNVVKNGYGKAIEKIIPGLFRGTKLKSEFEALLSEPDNSAKMRALYTKACSLRRIQRMSPYLDKFKKVIFSQHNVRGGAYFFRHVHTAGGYEGKGIELLTMDGAYGKVTHLLPTGEARDPDISFDGKKVLFAWRGGKSGDSKNYHIFEMDIETKTTRKITGNSASTSGYHHGCNDYEAIYLPNGDILFHSTRHIQEIDCVGDPAVNMFLCDKDGNYMRRIAYDQVATCYPSLMPDGRVVYCRWDYNDKSHTYAHALFIMNPDGTAQREYCNNNSWWPTMILQQRPIPGTDKVMAMIGGYHTPQSGKIGIIDRSMGMQNGKGVTLLAPVRSPKDDKLCKWGSIPPSSKYPFKFDDSEFPHTNARPLDKWGQEPPTFAYPYPFDENAFLVSFRPASKEKAWSGRFGLYFMTADGTRELLYFDEKGSCCSPVVVAPRKKPPIPASKVDYSKTTGIFQIMDVYHGQSPVMDGVVRGGIKRLRVAGLEYRAGPAISQKTGHFGPGCINHGGATYHTAPATENGSWDVKHIIGETPVYEDGSVNFIAPARMPLFFQLLDEKGEVVQTMRSWTMLQPGETFACYGCHESQLKATPPLKSIPKALQKPPVKLEDFYGPPRGFSFSKEIQPILDSKCISCHGAGKSKGINLVGKKAKYKGAITFSASYLNLVKHSKEKSENKYINWFHAEASPLLQPPYRAGSCKSNLVSMLRKGHNEVSVTKEELDKISCWIDLSVPYSGAYEEALGGSDRKKYEANLKRRKLWEEEEKENLRNFPTPVVNRNDYDFRNITFSETETKTMLWNFYASFIHSSRTVDLRFSIPYTMNMRHIRVELYNLQGRRIKILLNKKLHAGNHTCSIPVNGLNPGSYAVKIHTKGFSQAKIILSME